MAQDHAAATTLGTDQIDIAALLEHAYRLAGDKSIVLFEIIRQLQGWGHEAKLVVRQTCRIRSRDQRDFTEHLYLGWGDEVHSLEDPRRVLSLSQVMAGGIQAPRHMDECGLGDLARNTSTGWSRIIVLLRGHHRWTQRKWPAWWT